MLVEFFQNRYAPCMVQGRIVNERVRERVVRHVVANGGPEESTFLLSYDDAEEYLSAGEMEQVTAGWPVRKRLDDFTALTMYGYDANTVTH